MNELSPRERMLRAMRHQTPDRMPLTLDIGASAGIDTAYRDVFRRCTGAEDPAEFFDYDVRVVNAPLTPTADDFSRYYESVPPGTTFDEFGIGHVPAADFPLGLDLHPFRSFQTAREVELYPFPVFRLEESTHRAIEELHQRGYAVSAACGSINEWCCYLRGMDQFMMDMVLQPEIAKAILDRVTALCTDMGTALASSDVDVLCFYGDMGSQTALLLGPEMWAEWILPRWRKIIADVGRIAPHALTFYHSCGFIEPIISGLIDAGFDILNPVQPESMDPARIKRLFGSRLSLWGGIGMQSTMLKGSAAQVREATRALIDAWAPGSGSLVTVAQTILPDVPWENVSTLVQTVREHGAAIYR